MRIRAKYLINKRIQLGLTFRFVFLTVLFSIFIGFEVYITIWPVVSGAIPGPLMDLVRYQVIVRLLLFLIPIIFVITGFSIILTHRIAGPVYRLEKTLDELIEGKDVRYIKLRKNDELKPLAAKLNEVIRLFKELKSRTGETHSSQAEEKIIATKASLP
jgi:sensor histidine kinase YesM